MSTRPLRGRILDPDAGLDGAVKRSTPGRVIRTVMAQSVVAPIKWPLCEETVDGFGRRRR